MNSYHYLTTESQDSSLSFGCPSSSQESRREPSITCETILQGWFYVCFAQWVSNGTRPLVCVGIDWMDKAISKKLEAG
jgi:hypothetical protein